MRVRKDILNQLAGDIWLCNQWRQKRAIRGEEEGGVVHDFQLLI
jgi:hypothetical protein